MGHLIKVLYKKDKKESGSARHVFDALAWEVESSNLVVDLLVIEKRQGKEANKSEVCRLKTMERSEMRRNLDSKIAAILLHCH